MFVCMYACLCMDIKKRLLRPVASINSVYVEDIAGFLAKPIGTRRPMEVRGSEIRRTMLKMAA